MTNTFDSPNDSVRTSIRVEPFSMDIAAGMCPTERPGEPCTFVIIGATGDLCKRKLAPSLYRLYLNNSLPASFLIVGCGRTQLDDSGFRAQIKEALIAGAAMEMAQWESFAAHLHYQPLQYDSLSSYRELGRTLAKLEKAHNAEENRIYYCAIPPVLYDTVTGLIAQSGLSSEGNNKGGWTRIVVEKPFGTDLRSARALNQKLLQGFKENQIYRIDHYLAKETVQNILVLRFANAIFEPLWMRNYIDYVSIIAAEAIGIEHRAGYYESAGVLRDMMQNHLMQLLSMTAMEPPSRFEADLVRDESAKIFRSLRPFSETTPWENLVLGQYRAGMVEGQQARAYREEEGVKPQSLTPTFAMMRVFIDNWRWQGVPFYLTSGKRLAKKLTQIIIQFKEVPHSVFRHIIGERINANRLILEIQPDEKITLTFQTKYPGARVCLRSVTMDFSYHQNYAGPVLEAYEKVLLDCMSGDQMLFWRQDAVELCWAFLTPVLETCEFCAERAQQLNFYEAGTWGPAAAAALTRQINLKRR
jgi:glucose-6-phosphate 1-dehydrogenase